MLTTTPLGKPNTTVTATSGFDLVPRERLVLYIRKAPDEPIGRFLGEVQEVERLRRRQEAHQEINKKRERVDVHLLLKKLESPENKITLDENSLLEVLNTYPEDD